MSIEIAIKLALKQFSSHFAATAWRQTKCTGVVTNVHVLATSTSSDSMAGTEYVQLSQQDTCVCQQDTCVCLPASYAGQGAERQKAAACGSRPTSSRGGMVPGGALAGQLVGGAGCRCSHGFAATPGSRPPVYSWGLRKPIIVPAGSDISRPGVDGRARPPEGAGYHR